VKKWLLAAAGALVLGIAAWLGYSWFHRPPDVERSIKPQGASALDSVQPVSNVETVDVAAAANPEAGTTPMAERVAVIGLLNKRNGATRDLTMKPGQALRVGDVVVRLRACDQTAPWEAEHYTGAFVQVDVRQLDKRWARVFSGWLYKERPSLNVVQHPVYDVWVKSCAMSFPDSGPDTVVLSDAARSSAKKSADPADNATEGEDVPLTNAPATAPATASDKSPT